MCSRESAASAAGSGCAVRRRERNGERCRVGSGHGGSEFSSRQPEGHGGGDDQGGQCESHGGDQLQRNGLELALRCVESRMLAPDLWRLGHINLLQISAFLSTTASLFGVSGTNLPPI